MRAKQRPSLFLVTFSLVVMTTYEPGEKTRSAADFLKTNMAGDNRGIICTIFACHLFAHEEIFIAVLHLYFL